MPSRTRQTLVQASAGVLLASAIAACGVGASDSLRTASATTSEGAGGPVVVDGVPPFALDSIADVSQRSDLAITGTVQRETRESPDVDPDSGEVTTRRRLHVKVQESFFGKAVAGDVVVVRDFGYQRSSSGAERPLQASDQVRLQASDMVLMFLVPSPRYPDTYEMVTGSGGYLLRDDRVVTDSRSRVSGAAREIHGKTTSEVRTSAQRGRESRGGQGMK